MGNSIVDLGAAAVDYVSDAASDFVDYMTGSPEASASETYIERKSRKGQQLYSGRDPQKPFFDFGFAKGGVVDLGAGSPEEMEEFLEFLRKNRPVYKEGDERPYTYYSDRLMVPEEKRNTSDQEYEFLLPRADMYEGFAEPSYGITIEDVEKGTARLSDLQDEAEMGNPYAGTSGNFVPQQYEIVDGSVIANPVGFDDGGSVEGIMSVDLSKGADTTGPDTMRPIPQYPGIEGFDIYKDLAPEQFKRRPVAKQNFDKKRGFQFGQMVELRDDAVGGKLLKQAGIMTPVDQVKQTVDPKVMDQMSRILGREVV